VFPSSAISVNYFLRGLSFLSISHQPGLFLNSLSLMNLPRLIILLSLSLSINLNYFFNCLCSYPSASAISSTAFFIIYQPHPNSSTVFFIYPSASANSSTVTVSFLIHQPQLILQLSLFLSQASANSSTDSILYSPTSAKSSTIFFRFHQP
jgi:hypothetical protein